ncbi:MAG: hypothetical protein WBB98_04840 [Xanthobacteraceae bacterium]
MDEAERERSQAKWLRDMVQKYGVDTGNTITRAIGMLRELKRRDPAAYNVSDELDEIIQVLSKTDGE